MEIPRQVWMGGGALAFVLAVVVMVPPTKPIGGPKIDPNAHHGLAPLPAPTPQPAIQPVQMQPTEPVAPTGFSGDAAQVAAAGEQDRTEETAQPSSEQRYAMRDPRPVSDDEDRAFRAGYRWAERRGIDDPRACEAMDDGPGLDGCLAYARPAAQRRSQEEDDGSPWS